MGIFGKKQSDNRGFTIVELLIVIAVIAILAAVTIAVYPGYQQRTRDTQRKNDMSQLTAAFSAYLLQKDNFVESGSGCGLGGNGNGWLNGVGSLGGDTYPRAILSCLQDAKVLGAGTFMDPLSCTWASGGVCGVLSGTPAQAYMKVTCTKSSKSVTYVLTHLETMARKDAEVDALCDNGTVAGFTATTQKWGTRYGMNYYIQVR
jgi:prepilin-type N-terminal cleavage/methylation domain-containing protein